MPSFRSRTLAALSAISLFAHPLASVSTLGRTTGNPPPCHVVATSPLILGSVHAPSLSLMPVTFVPASAIPAAMLESQRTAISEILVELGTDQAQAEHMSTQLTAEDLAVLLANPRMMQKAGDVVLIIAALVVAGVIVALILAADSSTVVVSL